MRPSQFLRICPACREPQLWTGDAPDNPPMGKKLPHLKNKLEKEAPRKPSCMLFCLLALPSPDFACGALRPGPGATSSAAPAPANWAEGGKSQRLTDGPTDYACGKRGKPMLIGERSFTLSSPLQINLGARPKTSDGTKLTCGTN